MPFGPTNAPPFLPGLRDTSSVNGDKYLLNDIKP